MSEAPSFVCPIYRLTMRCALVAASGSSPESLPIHTMFQINSRIVCIDASPPRWGNTTDNPLRAGAVYNVTEYEGVRWPGDVPGVRVTGSRTFCVDGTEVFWNANRFRKYGDVGGVNHVEQSEPVEVK